MAGPRKSPPPGARPPGSRGSPPPRKLTTSGVDRGRPLADFIAERLAISRTAVESLVRSGSVYIGRRRVEDAARPLAAGDQVTVHAAAAPLAPGSPRRSDLESWVVHRDAEVLVIDKPPGVPSQATRSASAGALDRLVAEALDPAARLIHRLDRDASGLVLFTRTAVAHRRFADLLATGRLERTYLAAVWGHWPSHIRELTGSIGRDPHDHRRMAVGTGRPALTRVRLVRGGHVAGGQPASLLELDLVTGRTHQIRVHLSHAGHPVCGDALYGPEQPPLERLFLHAQRLAWPGGAAVTACVPAALADLIG